jgi:hypothetical protein
MGVYIYSVRTREIRANLNGEPVVVHPLSYLDKPYFPFTGSTYMRIGRAEAAWQSRPALKGTLVVLCDKTPKDGDEVVRYRYNSACCYDTESFGEPVGYMRKQGRKWTIVSTVYHASIVTKYEGGCMHIRKSSPALFDSDAVAAWAAQNAQECETVQVRACHGSV